MYDVVIQTIKTMVQSMIDDAGFDKTRTAQIASVNSITNTYSVVMDGQTYNDVKTVNNNTYAVNDVVRVVIPCNQPTQMYIESSVFSDTSIGNQISQLQQSVNQLQESIDAINAKNILIAQL